MKKISIKICTVLLAMTIVLSNGIAHAGTVQGSKAVPKPAVGQMAPSMRYCTSCTEVITYVKNYRGEYVYFDSYTEHESYEYVVGNCEIYTHRDLIYSYTEGRFMHKTYKVTNTIIR